MQIHGLIKTSLVDYPGYLACTIFTGCCNFRCPFCQNKGLVLSPGSEPVIPTETVLDYLQKRKTILEGVCISGGEPTLQAGLKDFIRSIKALGLKVKLDTNGTRPDVLKALQHENLLDYVAMDIKAPRNKYAEVSGIDSPDMDRIQESIDFIMSSMQDYEFRTTVVKELHSLDDIREIISWIRGCRLYTIQSYRDGDTVICPGFTAYTQEELDTLATEPWIKIANRS
ncbi:anaerobic ribonucleoside-triphosphate reductase activating protein [Parasporobacterium paucivorans]|uniref:Pyruvate formate lyase activating enzyme n=1 Tax=Parasporobacterium paucivorans DSM 15970 TaxID=1122934 RepID=A0A1M6BCI6_9FIRM|nr:anaerobic ribonucleoside-triphosphate reductase activating protein [Parasporobacterium paucivorans]SHI46278.1 pyruvate formate lyase activating enzyme [Parasporobacterium paucivorans DSM 15970]